MEASLAACCLLPFACLLPETRPSVAETHASRQSCLIISWERSCHETNVSMLMTLALLCGIAVATGLDNVGQAYFDQHQNEATTRNHGTFHFKQVYKGMFLDIWTLTKNTDPQTPKKMTQPAKTITLTQTR